MRKWQICVICRKYGIAHFENGRTLRGKEGERGGEEEEEARGARRGISKHDFVFLFLLFLLVSHPLLCRRRALAGRERVSVRVRGGRVRLGGRQKWKGMPAIRDRSRQRRRAIEGWTGPADDCSIGGERRERAALPFFVLHPDLVHHPSVLCYRWRFQHPPRHWLLAYVFSRRVSPESERVRCGERGKEGWREDEKGPNDVPNSSPTFKPVCRRRSQQWLSVLFP